MHCAVMPLDGWWLRAAAVLARLGFVRAAVLFGCVLVVVSEGLGAIDAFARGPVVLAWVVVAAAGAATLAWAGRRVEADPGAGPPGLRSHLRRDGLETIALGCVAVVLVLCLLTSLLSPPSNGDALSYHLPRVRHWIQNQSFAHYPTHSLHQISLPFVAGYAIAHLQLLSGGDRFASVPQWTAFLGCIIVAALLARRLFGGRAAVPAAVACATVPMAVLQASNAQSDLVTSFWLLCFARLLFDRRPYRAADVVWMGAALGLGIATKPTVLLFAPPFLAIIALRAARAGWRRGLGVPLAVVVVALLPGLPNTLRNVHTFGNALGPDLGLSLQRHDPGALASNVLRQAALSYPSIDLWKGIAWLHAHVLHVDASDPATTVALTGFVPRTARVFLNPDENQVASPVHVTLALVGAVAALRAARRRRVGWASRRVQLPVAIGVALLLFCAAIRWQPWANRLLLPLLLLASPLVGWLLANAATRIRAGLTCALVALALLYGLSSVRHPWVARHEAPSLSLLERTRDQLYFAEDELPSVGRELRASYDELSRRAASDGCARVGLISGDDEPEYLVWRALERAGGTPQIRNVAVMNASRTARAEIPGVDTCATVMLRNGRADYTPR
jgi:4-amino-4-deoxy-L-arabinose transferase-like glycosyltransferase